MKFPGLLTNMNAPTSLLPPEQLYRRCDPALLDFETTDQLEAGIESLDQPRATEAVELGIAMKQPGYNVFVLGEPGSGRHALVKRLIAGGTLDQSAPPDWCYVNNFDTPEKPRLLRLPPGRGAGLRRDMQEFARELPTAIATAFESEDFRNNVEAVQEELKQREEAALQQLGQQAGEEGLALLRTPHGFIFAPVKDHEALGPEEFAKLPDAERERFGALISRFGEELQQLMRLFPRWRREVQTRIKQLSRDTMSLAVGHLIEDIKAGYVDLPEVLAFLDGAMTDVMEVGSELKDESKSEGESGTTELTGRITAQRYLVNLVVDQDGNTGLPLVCEDHPTYPNLVGRVDQIAHFGALVTNFTMIRGGALHRANGGYLLLDVEKVLAQPYAWEGLKRALKSGQVRIESLGQVYGLVSTQSLEPEPMPLDVKVVLFGERLIYYLLREYDPEFPFLFKVAADFDDSVERCPEQTRLYARLVATLARQNRLRPLHREAVARVIEHAARLAEDAERLSTASRHVSDLLQQADHQAARAGHERIERDDVVAALEAQRRRNSRIPERILDAMKREILLIDTSGTRVGQVNGLAVGELGDAAFGHPVRISATVRLGEGDVLDIERESEMGGAIHSKGVMILSSFLASRFARELPLSLSASLVFEQSYGPVEGDSASLAELCALLSALAGAPIRQSLAMTGSVNQHGQVQAIGGVNEKIEGFFDLCAARGLSGDQGVLIPKANIKHLMLREDVVAACAAGRFQIHGVTDVDQAIELLTGIAAGAPDAQGNVPIGSINHAVASQIAELSALRQVYGAPSRRHRKRLRK
ncbi:Lon protease family protein [Denitratisoma oestradiolicum]|uniref:endopeptidase La n=1 Tax=Denitratisoma oestradiolicum TaxID=311182 RepID=A0A6S6YJB9_9PROT|nr:ATP-binding protein [Denitratisoma oestradiolicum]CAB1367834.1 Endopeptidase La [Denitratisoma oestradiolicum]